MHGSITFASAGRVLPEALRVLKQGRTMTRILELDHSLRYWERTVRSLATLTRRDARELLALAAEIPIQTTVQTFFGGCL